MITELPFSDKKLSFILSFYFVKEGIVTIRLTQQLGHSLGPTNPRPYAVDEETFPHKSSID